MAKTILPEEIEAYYFGRLPEKERKELEQRIQDDESLKAELDTYVQILDGFMAKKTEDFSQQMKNWENKGEFKDQDEMALIECYLNDELHPINKEKIEAQIVSDQTFAKKVKQQEQLFDGFEAKKSDAFAEKLKAWEDGTSTVKLPKKEAKVRSLFQRVAAAAAVIVLLGVGTNWYADANYSHGALANKFYQKPLSDATLGGKTTSKSAWLANYEKAHQKMNNGDFWNARQDFEMLSGELYDLGLDEYNEKLYEDNMDWNITLAWLGVNDIQKASNRLRTISNNSDHTYQGKAKELLTQFDSFWYNIAN